MKNKNKSTIKDVISQLEQIAQMCEEKVSLGNAPDDTKLQVSEFRSELEKLKKKHNV